jgi:hypothetical protein
MHQVVGHAVRRAAEIALVVLVVVLLLALARQMLTMSYRVMGHDTDYYLGVGRQVAAGLIPYRDFSFEYPPAALPAVVLPVVLASAAGFANSLDGTSYVVLLALENAVIVTITAACLVWLARRGWSARPAPATVVVYALLVVATPILFWRFDALPALMTVLALCALAAARPAAAGIALAAGAAVKLYPLALLPVLVLRSAMAGAWRDAGRLIVGAVVPLVVGGAFMFAGGGSGALAFLGYQSTRGVQVESVPASVALLEHALTGSQVSVFEGFGSWQLESSLLEQVGWLWPIVAIVLLLTVALAGAASFREDVRSRGGVQPQTTVAMTAATIVVTLLAYRVLSPQYVVWLLPFAALLPRGKVTLTLVISALTLYIFPFGYEGLLHFQFDGIAALALRNGLLVALLIWLVAPGLKLVMAPLGRSIGSGTRSRSARGPAAERGTSAGRA